MVAKNVRLTALSAVLHSSAMYVQTQALKQGSSFTSHGPQTDCPAD